MFTQIISGFILPVLFHSFFPSPKFAQVGFYPSGIEIVVLNGALPASVSTGLSERFTKRFNMPLIIHRDDLDISSTFDRRRGQVNGQKMLDLANSQGKESGIYVIYVITEDLYDKGFNFLFAFTDYAQHETVLSTHRFFDSKTDPKTIADRMEKVLLRRIGFAYGLTSSDCIMRFSNNLNELDTAAPQYCPKDEETLISRHVLRPPT